MGMVLRQGSLATLGLSAVAVVLLLRGRATRGGWCGHDQDVRRQSPAATDREDREE